MYYEINISLHGKHFFATDERSLTSWFDVIKVYPVLKQKFPAEEGYEITITKHELIGYMLEQEELKELDAILNK